MGSLFQVIYPFSEPLPLKKARAIQYIRTCHAMAEAGIKVHALFGKDASCSEHECLEYYGLEPHPNLTLWRLPILRKKDESRLGVSWNALFNHACVLRIKALVRENPASVLYVRHIKLARHLIGTRSLDRNLPLIFEAHEIFSATTDKTSRSPKLREMEEAVFHAARGIVSISSGLKEEIGLEFGPSAPIHVVPDGADILSTPSSQRTPAPNTICYTGNLYAWKGVDTLVRAMEFLPDARLTVVGGEGPDIDRLKGIARESGSEDRITFVGWVPPGRVGEYLAKSAVAVVPLGMDLIASRYTSPLKLFEYMASGVPIVASDVPSLREVLADGENAVLVQPVEPHALAGGIQRVLGDEGMARRISQQAMEDVKGYTWQKRGEKIGEIVRKVLDRG